MDSDTDLPQVKAIPIVEWLKARKWRLIFYVWAIGFIVTFGHSFNNIADVCAEPGTYFGMAPSHAECRVLATTGTSALWFLYWSVQWSR